MDGFVIDEPVGAGIDEGHVFFEFNDWDIFAVASWIPVTSEGAVVLIDAEAFFKDEDIARKRGIETFGVDVISQTTDVGGSVDIAMGAVDGNVVLDVSKDIWSSSGLDMEVLSWAAVLEVEEEGFAETAVATEIEGRLQRLIELSGW